jgi:hypothetical protein
MSEFLRVKQSGCEVNEHQDRKQERDDGDEIHGLPQLLTGLDVQKGHGKENDGVEKHGDILHWKTLDSERHGALQARVIPKSILRGGALCWWKGNLKEL